MMCSKFVSEIKGNKRIDKRGVVSFVNDFQFENVRRFYTITHPDINVIRAWQGHKLEYKYFHVVKGSFVVAWVEVDDWKNPSGDLIAQHKILFDKQSEILCLPPGYANGLKALEPDSQIIVFSSATIDDAVHDQYKFDKDLWMDWSQFD